MTVDICKPIFKTLAFRRVMFSEGLFKSLMDTSLRQPEDALIQYEPTRAFNGLAFENPMGSPPIPN